MLESIANSIKMALISIGGAIIGTVVYGVNDLSVGTIVQGDPAYILIGTAAFIDLSLLLIIVELVIKHNQKGN